MDEPCWTIASAFQRGACLSAWSKATRLNQDEKTAASNRNEQTFCFFFALSLFEDVDKWVWHPCAQESVDVDAGDRILLYTGARDGTPDGPGSVGQLIWTVQRDWTVQSMELMLPVNVRLHSAAR